MLISNNVFVSVLLNGISAIFRPLMARIVAELKCRNLFRDYEIKQEHKIIQRNNADCFYRLVNNKLSGKRGL